MFDHIYPCQFPPILTPFARESDMSSRQTNINQQTYNLRVVKGVLLYKVAQGDTEPYQ